MVQSQPHSRRALTIEVKQLQGEGAPVTAPSTVLLTSVWNTFAQTRNQSNQVNTIHCLQAGIQGLDSFMGLTVDAKIYDRGMIGAKSLIALFHELAETGENHVTSEKGSMQEPRHSKGAHQASRS